MQNRLKLPNGADHTNSLGVVSSGLPDLADGQVHTARIVCGVRTLTVYVDDLNNPVLGVALPAAEAGEEGNLSEALALEW